MTRPLEAMFLEPVVLVYVDKFYPLTSGTHTSPTSGSSCLEYLITQTWVLRDKGLERQQLKYVYDYEIFTPPPKRDAWN